MNLRDGKCVIVVVTLGEEEEEKEERVETNGTVADASGVDISLFSSLSSATIRIPSISHNRYTKINDRRIILL